MKYSFVNKRANAIFYILRRFGLGLNHCQSYSNRLDLNNLFEYDQNVS